ncbi:MAG: sel1 repeat family protein [Alcanivoracaceae bacterium]|nr:sel1 repeat family protein [Alcanivoracaceae bacterium]
MKNTISVIAFLLFFSVVQAKDALVIPQSLLDQVDAGNAEVAYFIAKSYLDGNDTFEADQEQAMTWLEKSANMGYAHAMLDLANEYHDSNEQQQALSWYQRAADQGVANAFEAIASYYLLGEAGLQKSCITAYQWYEKAETREVKLAFNNHAWYLATSHDKKCRNPEKAIVVYAKMKALYKSDGEKIPWGFVDTEAAVLASISDFSAAIKLQAGLVEELKSYNMDVTNFQLHLDQYLLRKPWVEVIVD